MSVVTRYAPSPTGPQHIGGIRTALYCYLFTQNMGGKMILRIEDTDQERFVPGAEEFIREACEWLGITFDEGVHLGGPHGPYRQSERTEIYRKYADQLVKDGKAYLAFDTVEEIDAMRERMMAAGNKGPQYNFVTRGQMKNSLTLSEAEVQELLDQGVPYVVRLKVPKKEDIRFEDLVRGSVVIHSSHVDDKVLMKSDGYPTYHLANVVDDHLMGVTNVIRGEEWLPSTPLHVLLYRAFGWEDTMPQFSHLPLLLKPDVNVVISNKKIKKEMMGELPDLFFTAHPEVAAGFRSKAADFLQKAFRDRTSFVKWVKEDEKDTPELANFKSWLHGLFFGKLSKRDGDLHGFPVFPIEWTDPKTGDKLEGFREMGYLPEAFLNYLALLGWHPGTDEEIMSLDEMIAAFSLDRVHKGGAKFDLEKLNHFNQIYLRKEDPQKRLVQLKADLEAAGVPVPDSDAYLLGVIELVKERITFPREFVTWAPYFYAAPREFEDHFVSKMWKSEGVALLETLTQRFTEIGSWNAGDLETLFKSFLEEQGVGFGLLMSPLRLALTGLNYGPGAFEIMELIGKEESLSRIHYAFEKLGK